MRLRNGWKLPDPRPDSCDLLVFGEVWGEDVYRMACIPPPRLGQAALDLGANVGAWSLLAMHRGCPIVHAVEPQAANMQRLIRNVEAADLGHRLVAHEAAVVGSGVESLTLTAGDPAYPTITFHEAHGEDGVRVTATHIDSVLARAASWWCMKVDIEGGEFDVIGGVDLELLRRVDYITMEFHGPGMGQHVGWVEPGSLGALMEKLTEWGHVQTMGAASRGGQLYGWRYGVEHIHDTPVEGWR